MITAMVATTRVAWTGAVNKVIPFGLSTSEYVVVDIDGLGPLRADIITSELSGDAGANYLSSNQVERNIVIKLAYAPKYSLGSTVEKLRRSLSDVFTPPNEVELTFTDDILGSYVIRGRVESNDPVLFAKDPEVQISIICTDPYFYSPLAPVVFTIPPLTPFNEQFVIDYQSDVPVGFLFDYDMTSGPSTGSDYALLQLNETQNANGRDPQMRLNGNFQAGDHFTISSERGTRGAKRIRSGAISNAMPYFSGSLLRMKLRPGLNYLSLYPVFTSGGAKAKNAKITYKRIRGSL